MEKIDGNIKIAHYHKKDSVLYYKTFSYCHLLFFTNSQKELERLFRFAFDMANAYQITIFLICLQNRLDFHRIVLFGTASSKRIVFSPLVEVFLLRRYKNKNAIIFRKHTHTVDKNFPK